MTIIALDNPVGEITHARLHGYSVRLKMGPAVVIRLVWGSGADPFSATDGEVINIKVEGDAYSSLADAGFSKSSIEALIAGLTPNS